MVISIKFDSRMS